MIIQVENLTKRYGRNTAVRDVSFVIERGHVVGFLGPNGAGKSTTMRMLTGYLPPTSGRITIDGLDVMRDSLEIRRRIGYMPETAPLYPEMRVREYLRFRAVLKGVPAKAIRDRMSEVLHLCGLQNESRVIIGRLSKGYRQRVALADTLINDPPILILDEPTIGLDPNQIRQTRELIKGLAGRHTVLLSTHILPEVEATCSRVLIISQGRIVASDSSDRLAGILRGEVKVVAEVRGPLNDVMEACRGLPGVSRVSGEADGEWTRVTVECGRETDIRADLGARLAGRGWPIRELTRERRSNLEDVFVALTRSGGVQ